MSQPNLAIFNNLCVKQDKSENLYVYQIDDNTFILSKKLDDGYRQATIITRSTYTALDSLSPKMISRILALTPEYDCLSSMWKALRDTHNPHRDDLFKNTDNPSFIVQNLDYLLFKSHITVQAYDMIYGYIVVKAYGNIYRIKIAKNKEWLLITNTKANELGDNAKDDCLMLPLSQAMTSNKVKLFDGIDFCLKELKA